MQGRFIQIGDWLFEITQLRARRAENYGDEYTGVADITITDGVPHIEGLLCKPPKFSRKDYRAFTELLIDNFGLDPNYLRIKDGVKKHKSPKAPEKIEVEKTI